MSAKSPAQNLKHSERCPISVSNYYLITPQQVSLPEGEKIQVHSLLITGQEYNFHIRELASVTKDPSQNLRSPTSASYLLHFNVPLKGKNKICLQQKLLSSRESCLHYQTALVFHWLIFKCSAINFQIKMSYHPILEVLLLNNLVPNYGTKMSPILRYFIQKSNAQLQFKKKKKKCE